MRSSTILRRRSRCRWNSVGQRAAIPGSEPFDQVDGVTRWVVHDACPYLMTGAPPQVRDKKNGKPDAIDVAAETR